MIHGSLEKINALSILGELEEHIFAAVICYAMARILTAGFGMVPGAKPCSAGLCGKVAALAICDSPPHKQRQQLCEWLSERQVLPSGGLNGRPEAPDVCYSWWVLSSLHGKLHWMTAHKLQAFHLGKQDETNGGVGDRRGIKRMFTLALGSQASFIRV